MNPLAERLSRVAALRPRPGTNNGRPTPAASSNSERLLLLLGGENRINRGGAHLRVRRRFPELQAKALDRSALELLTDSAQSACDPFQWLFLDVETTGLAGGTGTYAFLIGLAWWDDEGFIVEQHFMRDHAEERSALIDTLERFAPGRALVTFNGKSFDWPLLRTRFRMSRLVPEREPLAHIDLLHPARQLWKLSLASVALTELERHVLRLDRGPDIPSESIPRRYFDYLRGGAPEPIEEVFVHNQLDLCGLASLALHMNEILSAPENRCSTAGELFGASRLLQRRGEHGQAGRLYQMALAANLSGEAERLARKELAFMAKRQGDFESSTALWKKLLDDTSTGLVAYEQLAIHYERHASLPEEAAAVSRQALITLHAAFRAGRLSAKRYLGYHARFQRRLARLRAKTGA